MTLRLLLIGLLRWNTFSPPSSPPPFASLINIYFLIFLLKKRTHKEGNTTTSTKTSQCIRCYQPDIHLAEYSVYQYLKDLNTHCRGIKHDTLPQGTVTHPQKNQQERTECILKTPLIQSEFSEPSYTGAFCASLRDGVPRVGATTEEAEKHFQQPSEAVAPLCCTDLCASWTSLTEEVTSTALCFNLSFKNSLLLCNHAIQLSRTSLIMLNQQ